MRHSRQVDHYADVWIPERASHIAKSRQRLFTTKKHYPRKSLQGRVITFRIDDAQAIALQDELLAKQTGNPRLARTRIASDQNDATVNRHFEWTPFRCLSQKYATTIHAIGWKASALDD